MSKRIMLSLALLSAAFVIPLSAQSVSGDLTKFNFNLGGGVNTPLNPTGHYVGVGGAFRAGAGYNINKHSSIIGEFGWTGLPSNVLLHPLFAPFGSINLFSLTANYRYHIDSIKGSVFGVYTMMGGGWYYRRISVDRNFIVPPGTSCDPVFTWWGYACDSDGIVTETIAQRGSSAGGLNGGVGFTLRLGDKGWKFYTEARYNYAFSNRVPTTFIPVILGIRYN
ncbi:MAG TPA: outer membrane beta-barrel protein [Bryobacteraceae bacterium]|nr:outer membrane beta-barrel protein [Bryobacteraceae bacterium]